MMAGKIPAFFLPVPGQSTKEVAAGSALPGHAGHGLVVFQLCGLSVVCGLCRASILAGLAGMQGYASPLRSPGPSFPSAVIFRSFTRSDFAVSPSNSRQPCASGLCRGFFFCNHHNLRTQCDIVTSIVVHIDAIFPA
ncbi:TPA: hypothetical protein ACTAJP_004729 [Salmonella enterica subsp. enterica serovar Typhimurium]